MVLLREQPWLYGDSCGATLFLREGMTPYRRKNKRPERKVKLMQLIGSLFGYVLWGVYQLVHNYAFAILIFTILIKLLLFPSSVKQQKTMAKNARLQAKQREIREKYGNNRVKIQEETQKLYAQEGVSPSSGCLSTLIPMFLMIGIFYAVAYPLTNTLHLGKDMINEAKNTLVSIPGINVSATAMYEGQIDIMKYFDIEAVRNCFEGASIPVEKIADFCSGFKFMGFNLMETPNTHGFSWYLMIPVLSFVTSVGSQLIIQRLNNKGNPQAQQGCMKVMILLLPLFSAWISYTVPAAVGFYWICSTVLGFVQSVILHYYFGPGMMIARGEAARIALLEQRESSVKRI